MINTFDKIHCKIQESIPSFIRKTYDILEEAKYPDIIDWNPEGTALVIKKASEFCQNVLPAYFKHNNLTSFVRQLNMYNFHKKRTHSNEHIYYHELFQKGKRHLLKEIKRKTADTNFEKDLKTSELSDSSPQGKDVSSLIYENQMLKRLYKETMTKLHMFENEVKELHSKNQALWNQINKNGQNQIDSNGFSNSSSQNSNFVSDQFSNTTGIVYPSYSEYGAENHQVPSQYEVPFDKKPTTQSYFSNLSNYEFSGDSTEPSLNNVENDRGFEWTEPTPSTAPYNQDFPSDEAFQLPGQQNQVMRPINEQYITGGEIQQVNIYNTGNDYFNYNNIQKPSNVLGKRQFENVNIEPQLEGFEPFPKRFEVSNFNKSKLGVLNEGYEMGMDMIGNTNTNTNTNNNMGFYSWGSN